MKPKLLLIDADIYAYLYASAAEKAYDWGDGQWTLHADEVTAWANMQSDIDSTLATLGADRLVVCLSSPKSWRRERIYPDYKSNRDGIRRPMILKALKDHLTRCYETVQLDWLEADDVMGLLATTPDYRPEYDKIIVSADKDMLTIPTVVWNMKYDRDGKPILHYVTEEEADYKLRVQTLTGDPADGYPGCKGIGAVRAAKIATEGWDAVRAAFLKAGHDEDYFLSQARCARILRHGDFDHDKMEPKLWTPHAGTAE